MRKVCVTALNVLFGILFFMKCVWVMTLQSCAKLIGTDSPPIEIDNCIFIFASEMRQIQCTHAEILMSLMDEAHRAKCTGQATKCSIYKGINLSQKNRFQYS